MDIVDPVLQILWRLGLVFHQQRVVLVDALLHGLVSEHSRDGRQKIGSDIISGYRDTCVLGEQLVTVEDLSMAQFVCKTNHWGLEISNRSDEVLLGTLADIDNLSVGWST
jgi:hypothetical protein